MYCPLSPTAADYVSALDRRVRLSASSQLNLNSFGSSRRSLVPSASEGLKGLVGSGLTFSLFGTSVVPLTGFLEVNGSRKGGILNKRVDTSSCSVHDYAGHRGAKGCRKLDT